MVKEILSQHTEANAAKKDAAISGHRIVTSAVPLKNTDQSLSCIVMKIKNNTVAFAQTIVIADPTMAAASLIRPDAKYGRPKLMTPTANPIDIMAVIVE